MAQQPRFSPPFLASFGSGFGVGVRVRVRVTFRELGWIYARALFLVLGSAS